MKRAFEAILYKLIKKDVLNIGILVFIFKICDIWLKIKKQKINLFLVKLYVNLY